MLIGYARVSTLDQELGLQIEALKSAGCERIFTEKASGAQEDRPEPLKAFDQLRPDDVLVVWKLDRLARSLKQLIALLDRLRDAKAHFRCLNPHMDTTTPEGRLFYSITGAFAEFEREIIRQRTKAGLAAAVARGRKGGRPPALSDDDLRAIKALLRGDLTLSVGAIAKRFAVSRTTIYAHVPEARRNAELMALRAEVQVGLDQIAASRDRPFNAARIVKAGTRRLPASKS